jgi:hypothetical protein
MFSLGAKNQYSQVEQLNFIKKTLIKCKKDGYKNITFTGKLYDENIKIIESLGYYIKCVSWQNSSAYIYRISNIQHDDEPKRVLLIC